MESMAFQKVVQRIRFLVESNAKHKRGFRLGEVTDMSPLIHLQEEVTEVMWEEDRMGGAGSCDPQMEHEERIQDELGDALGCWLHYIIRKGFPLEKLLERYADSLLEDFPGAFPEKADA